MGLHENHDIFTTITGVESVNGEAIYSTACAAYVLIKEELISSTTTLCAGQSQGRHMYTSTSNVLEISFVQTNIDDEKYFLIEYEGKPLDR